MRGWNVAIPEVDMGDDIFVVQDNNGTLRRVQVKTSTATTRKDSFSGQFSISIRNLRNISNILVHYIFVIRHNDGWSDPVIIRQDYLLDQFENNGLGSEANGNVLFYFSYGTNKIECSGKDLTFYLKNFADFPKIEH